MRYRSRSGRVYSRLGINALEVSQRSIDAWKRHDADALVAVYAEGGTYHNPRFDHPLTGQAIADFAKSVWAAYPDMSLEIISRGATGGGLVATQWVLHGTHTGPLMDVTPPTGRTVMRASSVLNTGICSLLRIAPSVVPHGSRVALQFSPIMNKRPIRICGTEDQSLRVRYRGEFRSVGLRIRRHWQTYRSKP